MLFHYTVAYGEAQTRSFPSFLGSKKGFENPAKAFFVNPATRVRTGDPNLAVFMWTLGAYRQGTASVHRLRRVDNEVDEDLFELVFIAYNLRKGSTKMSLNRNISQKDMILQKADHVAQNSVDLNRLWLTDFLPRKIEQPLDNDFTSVGQLVDLDDIFPVRVILGQVFHEQMAVHHDTAKGSIQLMGDLAGQPAGGLQTFGSKEGPLSFGRSHMLFRVFQ